MSDRDLTIERLDREVRALTERVAVLESKAPPAMPTHTPECRIRSALAEHWRCDCSGVMADYGDVP